jgi:uncharacterized 2Fe-2S/4Fe-4S cluster protein (DUF4445 family)
MESFLSSVLRHQPLIEIVYLELPPPHLDDNTGDLDRLVRALKQERYSPLWIHPLSIGYLAQHIRQGNFKVTVVLGYSFHFWEVMEVIPGVSKDPILGIGLDVGTTQLAFYLMDLKKGELLEKASVRNPQIPYGEDILTRIIFVRQEKNRKKFKEILIDAINRTVQEIVHGKGYSFQSVYVLSVAANTTMAHFLLGLDPSNICKEPYIPVANRFPFFHAQDLGLALHPRALVYIFPNVGSYFGGDLIAGILSTGMQRAEEISMLVDVGTNAEVVLGNCDWLIACAGAAGPALEGGVVERGMMAAPGAIDQVRIDPHTLELSYRVLGNEKPRGICGSGLIDLIAEMFRAGILTIQGKISTKIPSRRIVNTPDGLAFVVAYKEEAADGKDLLVSEIDIGILLKSKAAMFTILSVITKKVGIELNDVEHFYVAGTFGNHIDPAMAVRIGMLPDRPLESYVGVGNAAGHGAVMLLCDRSLLEDIEKICNHITYVELNVNMELMNEFRGALFLPHTDPRLFPSVDIPKTVSGPGEQNERQELGEG